MPFTLRVLATAGLLVSLSCSSTGNKGEPQTEVTATVAVLSPFAAEVRWTTAEETVSRVHFRIDGEAEEAVVEEGLALEHRVLLQGLEPSSTYDFRIGDGTPFTGNGSFSTHPAPAAPFRVLFDNAHGEQAGNADWVIDDDWPVPLPANPASEDSWSGAYSAWGFELHRTGRYEVFTLPPGESFTFGEGGSLDLANFDVVVLPEPNNEIPAAGLAALEAYAAAGGGLFLIANHEGSDRDNDGWESYLVLNELADLAPGWGWRFDAQSFSQFPANDERVGDPRESILHGLYGEVARVGFYSTTSLRIFPEDNPRMRPIFWRPNQSGDAGLLIAAGWYGAGRVVVLADSAPADDGTANPGNSNIFDSWHSTEEDNAAFFLNATAWLAREQG